ncbi:MAG: hypothetical protein ACK5T5_09700 [Phenylobacterium sp.]|jgi:hypothetical protein
MDDDPILMSLADALTCAFGASIALFLIFVVLVRFEPPSPLPTSGAIESQTLTASLAADTPGASSLVIIARSDLDASSCARSVVGSLKILGTDPSGVRIWDAEQPSWSGANRDGVLCQRVFEVPAGVTQQSRPSVVATRGGNEVVQMRVHVGANAWPSWDGFHPARMTPAVGPNGLELLTITGDRDRPVRVPEER